MLWSLALLVVCLLLAAGVFLVASVTDVPAAAAAGGSPWQRFLGGLRHLRAQREARIPGRARTAVAHHAVGAPSVWVGRGQRPDAGRGTARPEAPVDMLMDEFFAATIESKPGYVDAEELTVALQRARVQASRTLHVPLGTISRPE
jgi:hypothetical protein